MFKNVVRALARIFPDCVTLCQAIAFNMFLAFFPLLLFSLGFMAITSHFVDAVREIPDRLSLILPPGSMTVVAAYFVRRVLRPWRWMFLGLIGTLLAGTQVMAGYMEGFRIIEGDLLGPTYWRRQLRALSLLCLTIVPMLAVVVLTVYGKQIREWLMLETGSVSLTRVLELAIFAGAVFPLGDGRSCAALSHRPAGPQGLAQFASGSSGLHGSLVGRRYFFQLLHAEDALRFRLPRAGCGDRFASVDVSHRHRRFPRCCL